MFREKGVDEDIPTDEATLGGGTKAVMVER
jgi:hypothetical protein